MFPELYLNYLLFGRPGARGAYELNHVLCLTHVKRTHALHTYFAYNRPGRRIIVINKRF
jgi:hypothetical protein